MLEHFEREYSALNKLYLIYTNAWPGAENLPSKIFIWFVFVVSSVFVPVQLLMVYDNWKDVQVIFEIGYQISVTNNLLARILNLILNREKFKRLLIITNDHWNIFTSKSEVQTLRKYSDISRKLTILYTVALSFTTVLFLSTPLTPILLDIIQPLNETRERLFPITIKTRLMDSEKYYVEVYSYISFCIVTLLGHWIVHDGTFLVYFVHACGLFSIISQQLEEITTKLHDKDKDIKKIECWTETKLEYENEQMIYQEYIICLKKYQLALEYINILNSSYEIVSLLALLMFGATLACCGMQLLIVMDQVQEVMRYVFVIIVTLSQLLMLCYSGQILSDESQDVFYRAYAAEWYNCSAKFKSLLIVTLYRSVEPCGLVAGSMVPLNLETYGFVVRTTGSYFMTFLSLRDSSSS